MDNPAAAITVAPLLIDTFRRGNALFLFGSGGSAADAQPIAAEFLSRLRRSD